MKEEGTGGVCRNNKITGRRSVGSPKKGLTDTHYLHLVNLRRKKDNEDMDVLWAMRLLM